MATLPEQDAVQSAAITIARNIIENDHSEDFLLHMMEHLIAFSEHIVDKAEKNDKELRVACSSGCSYCCHMQVRVTPPESFLIFSHIDETFTEEEKERLHRRIDNNRELTEGRSLDDRVLVKKETPCIFLTDHACDIYSVRPLICRAWHSLNKNGCIRAFLSENANAEIETAPLRNYVFGMIREAIHSICDQEDWEYETCELPFAMDSCFNDPSPMKNWLLHHHLFEKKSH